MVTPSQNQRIDARLIQDQSSTQSVVEAAFQYPSNGSSVHSEVEPHYYCVGFCSTRWKNQLLVVAPLHIRSNGYQCFSGVLECRLMSSLCFWISSSNRLCSSAAADFFRASSWAAATHTMLAVRENIERQQGGEILGLSDLEYSFNCFTKALISS